MLNRTQILAQGQTTDDAEVNDELRTAFYYSKRYKDWDQFIQNTRFLVDGIITYMDGAAETAKPLIPNAARVESMREINANKRKSPPNMKGRKYTVPNSKKGRYNYNTNRYEPKCPLTSIAECVPYLPKDHGARLEFRALVQRGTPFLTAFEQTLQKYGGRK